MRIRTVSLALAAAAVMILGLASNGLAFHDGGVANCAGCHTMHNSLGNAAVETGGPSGAAMSQFTAGPYLLKGNDQSSACLNCHEGDPGSYRVSTRGILKTATTPVPAQRGAGGDFSWLKFGTTLDNTLAIRGHNIVAADFGYAADTRTGMATSPGGSYPNNKFYCTSCHDPHGKYRVKDDGSVVTGGIPTETHGSYADDPDPSATAAVGAFRILAGDGYSPKSLAGAHTFTKTVPAAVAPATYNLSETAGVNVRVAYGSGMSEWCANCHGSIHNDSYPTNLRHPSGNNATLKSEIIDNYNAYVKTGVFTGSQATSYLSLTPFETGDDNGPTGRAALKALALANSTEGPTTGANVMCLSCHRAHASGFNSMLRWNGGTTFITAEDGSAQYLVRSGWTQEAEDAAYYNRPASGFAAYQRNLCNKCHAKD